MDEGIWSNAQFKSGGEDWCESSPEGINSFIYLHIVWFLWPQVQTEGGHIVTILK